MIGCSKSGNTSRNLSHLIKMNFSTPWRPSLHGCELQDCALVQDLVEGMSVPNHLDAAKLPWSFQGVRAEVESAPQATQALVESIFAIWRLKETQEKGIRDPVWRLHIRAWLVRRSLCVTRYKAADDGKYRPDTLLSASPRRFCPLGWSEPSLIT